MKEGVKRSKKEQIYKIDRNFSRMEIDRELEQEKNKRK